MKKTKATNFVAVARAAEKLAGGVSPWTERKWSGGDSAYVIRDFKLWLNGVRDHRLSDFVAVNAEVLNKVFAPSDEYKQLVKEKP